MNQRNQSLETLRGLAIVFMVMGHVIGNTGDVGLKVPDTSSWRYFYNSYTLFNMPLFAFIAGVVYAYKGIGNNGLLNFILDKAQRLLLPLWAVGSAYFLIQTQISGTNVTAQLSEIWRFFVFPYAHFWFLYSLFLIFTVTALLERLRLPATPGRLAMCFFLSCAAFLWVELPVHRDYLSVNGAVYLLPAFLAGLGVSRFTAAVVKLPCKPAWAGVAAFALAAALHHGTLLGLVDADISRRGPISLVCAVAGSYALYVWQPVSRFWAYLGAHSYAIYLFHIFATAGTRLVMHKIQMTDTATVFITSTLAGIVLPLLAETVCARFAVGRYVLLGGKWRSGTSAQQTIPKRR